MANIIVAAETVAAAHKLNRVIDVLRPPINTNKNKTSVPGRTLRRLYYLYASSSPAWGKLRSFRRKALASIIIATADMEEEEAVCLAKALMPSAKTRFVTVEVEEEELEEGKSA
ncbi:hypothetical protein A1Q2_03442 [Trichosporon asahii var. asahii CBS 8904]|uniref:Uncharacterized protein n=1 Tax=Trichosporon asahii var. asahii (strain CBS 8904) TaxID=1220162 RepID=K1VE64_TRIAC|nr:hypothetical protein A1Q2_03442 [Trichosporon asahii var. asahii CBS 8904]